MALSIKDDEADRLARVRPRVSTLVEDVERIGLRNTSRPWLDQRSPEAILGYDDNGCPS